jgi:hypothetical protein
VKSTALEGYVACLQTAYLRLGSHLDENVQLTTEDATFNLRMKLPTIYETYDVL